MENFTATELLIPVFRGGRQIYALPSLEQVRRHCAEELDGVWDEVKRFENPHQYYVDLSLDLWKIKNELLEQHTAN